MWEFRGGFAATNSKILMAQSIFQEWAREAGRNSSIHWTFERGFYGLSVQSTACKCDYATTIYERIDRRVSILSDALSNREQLIFYWSDSTLLRLSFDNFVIIILMLLTVSLSYIQILVKLSCMYKDYGFGKYVNIFNYLVTSYYLQTFLSK